MLSGVVRGEGKLSLATIHLNKNNQSINQSTNQPIHRNETVNINQSINSSTHRSTQVHRFINQINQSLSQMIFINERLILRS